MTRNKKRIVITSAVAATLFIGGTAAFFTSSDLITNIFQTGTTKTDNQNEGIDVNENFIGKTPGPDGIFGTSDDVTVTFDNIIDPAKAGETVVTVGDNGSYVSGNGSTYVPNANGTFDIIAPDGTNTGGKAIVQPSTDRDGKPIFIVGPAEVLPGQLFTKEVGIDSEANYNQLVRSKSIVTISSLPAGKTVAEALQYIDITYNLNRATTNGMDGQWIGTEPASTTLESDWFYYSKVLGPSPARTADVIKSVQLKSDAPNWMKNVQFTVSIQAESIQASADVWTTTWGKALAELPTEVDGQ